MYGQNQHKAAALAERYGGRAYDNLERFLDHRPMDIVAIGSPSALHAEEGIAAAERGLHVLVEKPLDMTTAKADASSPRRSRRREARRLLPGSAQAGRVTIKELVDAGAQDGRSSRRAMSSGIARRIRRRIALARTCALDGGGALINQAIHTFDLLHPLWGRSSVSTRGPRRTFTKSKSRTRSSRRCSSRAARSECSRVRPRSTPAIPDGRADGLERHGHHRPRQPGPPST